MSTDFESRFDAAYDGEIPASVDEAALERMETVAYVLDDSIRIPGTNTGVGVDPLLGLVPVAGDVISAGFSLYIVAEAAYLGVTYTTLVRMLANISIDVVGGAIPYVGTVFDALWKTNRRNVELALEALAGSPSETTDDGDDTETAVEIPVRPA